MSLRGSLRRLLMNLRLVGLARRANRTALSARAPYLSVQILCALCVFFVVNYIKNYNNTSFPVSLDL